eukprot:TRINITY_DN67731_c0_g1_i1.p1 TRINITY_DN67731_c0_g1~~TRINITY_DN67731_c0_g1_i1.p1  ORF type:complete len:222 (+),score=67.43 TRINITY_DN67731_c0_g1_i1:36-668(+)
MAEDQVTAESLTEEQLQKSIANLLDGRDLTQTSLKEVRSELEKVYSLDPGSLNVRKDKIKDLVSVEIARIQAGGEASSASSAAAGAAKPAEEGKRGQKRQREEEAEAEEDADDGEVDARQEAPGKKKKPPSNAKALQATALTRNAFVNQARAFKVKIGDKDLKADVKKFSTGSCGFFGNGKVNVSVGGQQLQCQVSLTVTVVGSKQWQDE